MDVFGRSLFTSMARPAARLGLAVLTLVTFGCDGSNLAKVHPEIAVSPTALDFGSVVVGGSATKSFTLENTSTTPMTVTGMVLAPQPSPFRVMTKIATVGPEQSVRVSVVFTAPKEPQDASATLTIQSDADNAPDILVQLIAQAVLPCAVGSCDAHATCDGSSGTAVCTCNQGYSGDGKTCAPVDSCQTNNGGCNANATCTSTGPGANSCACNDGYSGDGKTCAPVDSCQTNNGGCDANATCTSTGPGTNSCACNDGYSGDGKTCAPVDSCQTNNGGCDANATCTSTGPGTNSCACNDGYSGDGKTCTPSSSCARGQVSCGGICTDTKTDSNNCGGCGIVCPNGGACQNWSCPCPQFPPDVTLASDAGGQPYSIAVDDTSVYWTDQVKGTVSKISKNGGQATVLDNGSSVSPAGFFSPTYLAIDWERAYYVNQDNDDIMAVGLDGGQPVVLGKGGGSWPFGLAVDSAYAYWVIDTTGEVQKVSLLGGSAPTTLVDASQNVIDSNYLAGVDSTNVYWIYTGAPGAANGKIYKVSINAVDGVPVTLASGVDYPANGVIDGTSLYFTSGYDGGTDRLMKVSLAGGAPVTLASGLVFPRGLAVNGSNLYFAAGNTNSTLTGPCTVSTCNGTIIKVPIDGGAPTVLASCEQSPWKVAIDSTSTYWLDLYAGTVMKVPVK